ncbi:MAG: discoidin domain-containing protein, partial [Phycisphaeraceae bacterium]|nr:discoidin domain-containing protein [Phycisphaeraceae bacterium]
TATCGQEIFRGDRLPKELVGDLFFAEPVGRLIRRTTITVKDGITYIANPYEKQKGEFIRSTDPNFRPINMVTAPDGTMYIVDMYRGIIQEGNWVRKGSYLRKVVEKYGLQNNIGHGRIWRLRHKDFKRGPQPKMLSEKPAQLVAHLAHPNGWWRVTAQKLLILRGDKSVGPALVKMAAGDSNHLARIHAIWTLEGLGLLDAATVKKGLADSHPQVRIAAIRASESLFKTGNDDLAPALKAMAKDKNPNVVIQYLMTARHVQLDGYQQIAQEVVSSTTSRGVKELGGKFTGAPSGKTGPVISKADRKLLSQGREIYQSLCFACHGEDGKGQPLGKAPEGTKIPPNAAKTLAPSLVGSKLLMGHPDGPINVILHGLTGPIDGKVYAGQMISMKSYDDKWVAAILSYLRNNFGNHGSMVRPEAVARVRKATADRKEPWTIEELRKAVPQLMTNRKQWKLKASHNSGSLKNAVDGKMNTRFDTGTAMKKGMWVQIDLPETTTVSGLVLDATGSDKDYPRGYTVHVSKDGRTFSKKPLAKGSGSGPKVQIDLPPTEARSIRITLTRGSRGKYWSIHEMQIYGTP